MLTGVIQKKTMKELVAAIESVDSSLYDVLELRLDACTDLCVQTLGRVHFPLPVLFTLRSKDQGGAYPYDEDQRLHTLAALVALHPTYMDLESTLSAQDIERLHSLSPETGIVLSHHDFYSTPDNLEDLLAAMRDKAPGAIYKIATYAHSCLDALRMLVFCKEAPVPVLGICMGADGATTRILAPVAHGLFCYCPVEESSAPGQLDAALLRSVYRVHLLNRDSAVYGLLGDPVDKSVGHVFHNKRNAEQGLNAVYVKWRVRREELARALPLLDRFGVRGLSVTMPLKELLPPLVVSLDGDAERIGAVNTLTAVPGGWHGSNTDAAGAVRALGMDLHNKQVVLLGAGGAAKAIVAECLKQTDLIRIFNRTPGKWMPGDLFTLPLSDVAELERRSCDVVINTLPFDRHIELPPLCLHATTVAMDISYGSDSVFLRDAGEQGCRCIDGTAMFVEQAGLQRLCWGLE